MNVSASPHQLQDGKLSELVALFGISPQYKSTGCENFVYVREFAFDALSTLSQRRDMENSGVLITCKRILN